MVQIKWTPSALEDLKNIHEFISRDSVKYARLQVLRLKTRVKILTKNPLAGKVVPELQNDLYRELVEGNYRIIYKIVERNIVHILTLHHTSRDFSSRAIH